jgi:hypothetical protein
MGREADAGKKRRPCGGAPRRGLILLSWGRMSPMRGGGSRGVLGGRRESCLLAYRRGGRRRGRGAADVESRRTEEAAPHSGASRGQRVENAPIFPQRGGQVTFPIIVALVQLPITWNAWFWRDSRFFPWTIGLKVKPNTPIGNLPIR